MRQKRTVQGSRKRWAMEGRQWLQRQLDAREWRQADLVRALGVPSGSVSRWVRGTQPPDPEYAEALAEVFGADVDYVLTLAGRRPELGEDDPDVRDIAATVRLLPPRERQCVAEFAQWQLEKTQRASKANAE